MFFGVREKEFDMGMFSSTKCKKCKKSYTYRLYKITKFFVAFFVNLIPLHSEYKIICNDCDNTEAVDQKAARAVVKKDFRYANTVLNLQTILKLAAFAAVIAAAVVLPLLLFAAQTPTPEDFKALVSADGAYNIENSNGDILATIEVEGGVKALSFYDVVTPISGGAGAGSRFYKHEYFCEAQDDDENSTQLERITDDPGGLLDKYNTTVRSYYYDTANDILGYAHGVTDLAAIAYTATKVTYNYTYYTGEGEDDYTVVLYLNGSTRLRATFTPVLSGEEADQLVSLTVEALNNGRITGQTIYYFDNDTLDLAYAAGLLPSSSIDDILAFLDENNLDPMLISEYAYYKNTGVITKITLSQPDSNGETQTLTQTFEVTEKNGYYIQQAVDEEASS